MAPFSAAFALILFFLLLEIVSLLLGRSLFGADGADVDAPDIDVPDVGMRKLAEVIAASKKERAQIDAETDVAVRLAAMEAERRKIDIERSEEQARISQVQTLQSLRAAQEAEIQRDRELEVAEQERQIIVAQKSEEESRARASADVAHGEAVKASEAVITARTVAEAERTKSVALIEAAREAEREATRIRINAQADRDATADRAAAMREEAQAEADAITIGAEAKKRDLLAQAEGQRAIIDAENVLSGEIIRMKVELEKLKALPEIVAQMVKPAEKIDSIRIHQITGLGNMNGAGNGNGTAAEKTPVNQAMDSILGMALQLPAMRRLGEDLGLSMDGDLAAVVKRAVTGDASNSAPTRRRRRRRSGPSPPRTAAAPPGADLLAPPLTRQPEPGPGPGTASGGGAALFHGCQRRTAP